MAAYTHTFTLTGSSQNLLGNSISWRDRCKNQVYVGREAPIPLVKAYVGAERLPLPPPAPLNASVGEILTSRRSRRDYSGTPLSLSQLSTLLKYACGVTDYVPAYDYNRLPLRTFPSSGGLQAPEVYLSIQAVDGVPIGLYHYHAGDHALQLLKPGNQSTTLHAVSFNQDFVKNAAVVFLLTGYYERLRWKYGEKSYRFVCIDTGFLGENIYLVTEALGLGACATSGFAEDAVEELLGINGKDELALLLVTVGMPIRSESR